MLLDLRRHGVWVVLLVVVLFQVFSFRRYYVDAIAPFPARNYDQCPLIETAYQQFDAMTEGYSLPWNGVTYQKSTIFPLLCLLLESLFGASRTTLICANLTFLVLGEVALVLFMSRRHGGVAALLGLGLYQLSGSLYFWAGGLDDLRFDFAGSITYGLAFMAIVKAYECPGRAASAWVAAACLLSIFTRSTTAVYLAGTLGLLFAWSGARAMLRPACPEARQRLRTSLVLLGACLACFGVYLLFRWCDFDAYYVNHLRSGENIVRWQMESVTTIWGQWQYYPLSFWTHFKVVLVASAALAALGVAAAWLQARLRSQQPTWKATDAFGAPCLVMTAGMLSLFIVLSGYSPSPVVVCVLSLALVFTCTDITASLLSRMSPPAFRRSVAVVSLAFGCAWFWWQWTHPYQPWAVLAGRESNRLFEDVRRELSPANAKEPSPFQQHRIAWLLHDSAANPSNFNIFLREHGFSLYGNLCHYHPVAVLQDEHTVQLLTRIRECDALIVAAGRAEVSYPSDQYITTNFAQWEPYVRDHFQKVGEYFVPSRLVLYRRKQGFQVARVAGVLPVKSGEPQAPPKLLLHRSDEIQAELVNPSSESVTVQLKLQSSSYLSLEWSLPLVSDWQPVRKEQKISGILFELPPGVATFRLRMKQSAPDAQPPALFIERMQFCQDHSAADGRLATRP